MKIRVWAPDAASVELILGERRVALQADAAGNWQTAEEADLKSGYKFSVDRGDPLPDPRSRWQPDGVHGASHLVISSPLPPPPAAARSRIDEREPLRDAVIYELHIGTFTPEGTYKAAQSKLAYLAQLGVTHLELMPIATFPGARGWGYDGVDLYAPFPAYGTPQDLAAFIQSCHSSGLGVLLDVVYNHLGPDGNYLGQYGPYFTDRYKTPWGPAINYDGPQSDGVRRFIIDNALMWLRDYGFDGLRLDAVHAIFSFEALHVLEELATAVRQLGTELGRRFLLIAESDLNDPRLVRTSSRGGYGLDAHWVDDFHHAVHRQFTGETDGYYADFHGLQDIARSLRDGYVYQGQYSVHRKRRHGRPPGAVGPHQLVVCAQNHDQIGNRAQGERLSMMLGVPQLKAVAALTLLSPFAVLLFQGEEWGARTPFLYFTDHHEELGRLVAEGRSREFSSFRWQGAIPDPQAAETFARSKLDWSELSDAPHADIYEWYRQLLRLRHRRGVSQTDAQAQGSAADFGRAKPVVKFNAKAGWLWFSYAGVLCVLNFTAAPQRIPLPKGEWDLVMASNSTAPLLGEAAPGEMGGNATRVYTQRRGV